MSLVFITKQCWILIANFPPETPHGFLLSLQTAAGGAIVLHIIGEPIQKENNIMKKDKLRD